jgi:quercetin dioxygenase-like cupin family protein
MEVSPQTEPERFTGVAGFRVLHINEIRAATSTAAPEPGQLTAGSTTWNRHPGNVSMVRYEPGARSHWHSHSGGQFLYVVEGEGWVQSRGEDPRGVGPGDGVSFAPGEVHWHGAKKNEILAHVTVTTGKPTWFEESAPPD